METQSKPLSQFIYSLFLMILIPGMMIFNLFWTWRSVRSMTDQELRSKAILANETISSSINKELIADIPQLQTRLNTIKRTSTEFEEISILTQDKTDFRIIASTNPTKVSTIADGYQATIAWKEQQPAAILGTYQSEDSSSIKRIWSVTNPILDGKTEIALVDTKVSLADIDQIIQSTLRQSLIILISTVVLTLLLLINHFRFFETALLAKRLQEVDKMKDDFISVASHELKTPIAAIRGYLDNILALNKDDLSQKVRDNIEIVVSQGERLNALVNDLLNVSRLEQGRLQFEMKPQNLQTVVGEIVKSLAIQAEQKKLKLEHVEANSSVTILADEMRLKEILTNIIGNAIKYTLEGEVKIYYQVENDNVKLFVKDSGVGMSPEARSHLFEKFYRIKTEKTAEIPGTGLGLWITKQMVEKMHGKIYVDSIENSGSQFALVFPLAKS